MILGVLYDPLNSALHDLADYRLSLRVLHWWVFVGQDHRFPPEKRVLLDRKSIVPCFQSLDYKFNLK